MQVGALEACFMAKRGYEVHLYEYRKGMSMCIIVGNGGVCVCKAGSFLL